MQAAGNTLWALAHMGTDCLPARVWNSLLPEVARGELPHPEHLRQIFQVQCWALAMHAGSAVRRLRTLSAQTAQVAGPQHSVLTMPNMPLSVHAA